MHGHHHHNDGIPDLVLYGQLQQAQFDQRCQSSEQWLHHRQMEAAAASLVYNQQVQTQAILESQWETQTMLRLMCENPGISPEELDRRLSEARKARAAAAAAERKAKAKQAQEAVEKFWRAVGPFLVIGGIALVLVIIACCSLPR